jgi:hypothetical protein
LFDGVSFAHTVGGGADEVGVAAFEEQTFGVVRLAEHFVGQQHAGDFECCGVICGRSGDGLAASYPGVVGGRGDSAGGGERGTVAGELHDRDAVVGAPADRFEGHVPAVCQHDDASHGAFDSGQPTFATC